MTRSIIAVLALLLYCNHSSAQGVVGIKTNLLYGAAAFTPNLGVEIGLGKHTTLDISAGFNPWNMDSSPNSNKKLVHIMVQPEFRYFLCERFHGHFFGVHALYSEYNINKHNLPMLFGKGSEDYRFYGHAYGAGLSYGYQLMLNKHWNLEFQVGAGYARMNYDKYDCRECGQKLESVKKNYFGPTRAAISVIYVIK